MKGARFMNMIICGADCIYQKDGYCCLDFISEVSDAAVEGCHYYKKGPAGSQDGVAVPCQKLTGKKT